MQATRPDIGEIDFAVEFQRFAGQHLFDVGPQRRKALRAECVDDGLADDVFAAQPDQLRIGLADEAIMQGAVAAHQHERRAVDDRLQLGFAGAQRFLGALAFGQLLKAAHRAFDAAGRTLERRDVHQYRDARAVGPFDDDLGADDALAGAQHIADRRRGE